ncbi:MAG: hypothetical protein E4G91_06800 [Candidatus Zixiibacteriota bacterium]|nr:MAG: hypothetical protein E4G91_06800 [candidate division Zixibacteria bacterium]
MSETIISVWSLIKDNLLHLDFELKRQNPYYFRIAKEAHLCLYRTMIRALRGSSGRIIKMKKVRKLVFRYQIGSKPWMRIKAVAVPNCRNAWRYSPPVTCDEPYISDEPLTERIETLGKLTSEHLIGFLEALAMIQSENFMCHYVDSRPITLTDEEMQTLEWLHMDVRNEYEHFSDDYYAGCASELVQAAELCISVVYEILWVSNSIISHDEECKGLRERFILAREGLSQLKQRLSAP